MGVHNLSLTWCIAFKGTLWKTLVSVDIRAWWWVERELKQVLLIGVLQEVTPPCEAHKHSQPMRGSMERGSWSMWVACVPHMTVVLFKGVWWEDPASSAEALPHLPPNYHMSSHCV